MSVKIGSTISHYRILDEIGAGGMATVYKAEDINLQRLVALKFLPPLMTINKEARQRFVNEAKSASLLDHHNICTIFEVNNTNDEEMFIAMAFYDGQTLDKIIAKGALELQKTINIILQTAEGLAKAHEKGIIHRDIKPANIMVTRDGIVKILDFGLAKLADQTALTRTGTILGTVAYMCPEQIRGDKVDPRCDIWALGAVLYEMLGGHPPFRADNEQAIVYAILNRDPKALAKVPQYLQKIIHKALSKNLDNRYQDIDQLIRDMKAKSTPDIELPVHENSIVVLPFNDFSAKKENEYFSDGLTEEIITDLSKVQNLLVISRGSAMTYKDTNKKVKEIGKELNVRYALEGSVRKAGNDLRIAAQLIDTEKDTHLWAEKYSGTLEDIFDIQEKVSRSIVNALQLKLSSQEKHKIDKRPIKNIHAYECYLRARQETYLFTPDAFERAIQYLQNGLEIIGENALLHAGLGYVYCQSIGSGIGPDNHINKAEEHAQKALNQDPDCAEAFLVLGVLHSSAYRLQRKAIDYFRRVLSVNPSDPHTLMFLATSLLLVGNTKEAVNLGELLLQVDPLTPMSRSIRAFARFFDGSMDKDMWKEGYEWLELDPYNSAALYFNAAVRVCMGKSSEASTLIDKYINPEWGDTYTKLSLLIQHTIQGKTRDIEVLLTDEFKRKIRRDTQYCLFVAIFFANAGMNDDALLWLESAVDGEFFNYHFIFTYEAVWDDIKNDNRFKKLIERMKVENDKLAV